jgi:hypothetical protein
MRRRGEARGGGLSGQRAAKPPTQQTPRIRPRRSASVAPLGGSGEAATGGNRYFFIPSNSTSKCSVAFGGIGPPGVPRSP